MKYIEKLKALKAERKLSNGEIARLSNIPLATITRIFNGSTPNPTFETISQIAIALGASIDEIAGLKQADPTPIPTPVAATLDSYAELLKEKDERIRELKEAKEKERKEKCRIAIAFACVVGFVFFFLVMDIINGSFGYFRY